MRVSDRQGYKTVSNRVQQARDLTAKSLENLSTQKKLHIPSDDPIGLTRVIRNKGLIKSIDQYQKNITYARGFFSKTEETIASIGENIMRAKEIALNAVNGAQNKETRSIMAEEAKQIAGQLISLGNTVFADKYIFGGFRTIEPPFNYEGSYMGDDGAIFVPVNRNEFIRINVNGRDLFAGGEDDSIMIHTVFNFLEHLLTNDINGIRSDMGEMDRHLDRVISVRSRIGGKLKGLESIDDRLGKEIIEYQKINEDIEGIDFFETTTDFKQAETTLQATLLASNKLLQPSLLNFLQ